jgi:hypothetical protein
MLHDHEKLSEFLDRLAGDENLQGEYVLHQDKVLNESGLSEGHKKLLKDGKLGPIRHELQTEVGSQSAYAVIKIVTGVIKSPT